MRTAKTLRPRPLQRGLSQVRATVDPNAKPTASSSAALEGCHTPLGRRRGLLASGLAAAVAALGRAALCPPPAAAESKIVKLKNVKDPKLQDALRAAVAGDLEGAEELFGRLIAEQPENASLWSNRGSVRVSLEKFEEAASDLSEAVKLAPLAPVPFLNRAIAFEALGRFQEAIDDCKAAIVNDPNEYAAWFNLGNVYARVEDYDRSLDAYTRAALLAPGIAGYRLREAGMLFQVEKAQEAKKVMQGLVRKYPNYTEAHAALAAVLWSEGKEQSAEGEFSVATEQNSRYRDMRWVHENLRWPPKMEDAMQSLLLIK